MDMDFWQHMLETRSAVSKQLEALRNDNKIGSSLDAEVTVYCNGDLHKALDQLGDELRFVFITSDAKVKDIDDATADSIKSDIGDRLSANIVTTSSPHTKCTRCWHHREDVGSHSEHPELCGRCVENVAGDGEQRLFA
jgi:isoleucyl-tRNA synthetase